MSRKNPAVDIRDPELRVQEWIDDEPGALDSLQANAEAVLRDEHGDVSVVSFDFVWLVCTRCGRPSQHVPSRGDTCYGGDSDDACIEVWGDLESFDVDGFRRAVFEYRAELLNLDREALDELERQRKKREGDV